MIQELSSFPSKRDWLEDVFQAIPSVVNYRDLMLTLSTAEWDTYRVFSVEDRKGGLGFGGLSPTGNFNVYASTPELSTKIFQVMHEACGRVPPRMILGSSHNREALRGIYELDQRVTESWQYHVMERPGEGQSLDHTEDFIFRVAEPTPEDVKLIKNWYQAHLKTSEFDPTQRYRRRFSFFPCFDCPRMRG